MPPATSRTKACSEDGGDQMIDRDKDGPPEQEVRGDRQRLEPLRVKQLEHHPDRGHRPDEARADPSPQAPPIAMAAMACRCRRSSRRLRRDRAGARAPSANQPLRCCRAPSSPASRAARRRRPQGSRPTALLQPATRSSRYRRMEQDEGHPNDMDHSVDSALARLSTRGCATKALASATPASCMVMTPERRGHVMLMAA